MFDLKKKKSNELTDEEEEIFEKNIAWLFGNARGGTTWVSLELLSHNTNSINEPHIEEHLSMSAFKRKNDIFIRRIDNPQKNSGYFFSEEYRTVWMKFLKKLILNRFYAQTKDIYKKTIVKEPVTLGATDIITECMRKSKIIILLRDGRDVLDSTFDAQSKGGFMTKTLNRQPLENRIPAVKNFSLLWTHRNEHFLETFKNHPENLRYMVKYEDILQNTSDELEKLYKFLEIEITKDEIHKIVEKFDFNKIPEDQRGSGKFHRSATPGLWKEHFNQEEIKIMEDVMGNTLKKIGYEI